MPNIFCDIYKYIYVDSTDFGERAVTFLAGGMDLDLLYHETPSDDRWNLHRKDPWCVVGEHKHCPFGELAHVDDDDPPPLGDDDDIVTLIFLLVPLEEAM